MRRNAMTHSWKFSLLVFAPVIVVFLLPALYILPVGITTALLTAFDPAPPGEASLFYLWIIVPILLACTLIFAGRGLQAMYTRRTSQRLLWLLTWVVFTLALFLALWLGLSVLTSVGASDKSPQVFLSKTALGATGMILLSQVFVIPWLAFALKRISQDQHIEKGAMQT
jgi:hypothetical protein